MSPRGIIAFLTALLIAPAALLSVAAPAQADTITTWISVKTPSGHIGPKVLDVKKWSMDDRGQVQIWDRQTANNSNQLWRITEIVRGSGVYQIQNVNSGKCLDKSTDAPDANGTPVYQYTCQTGWITNQAWQFVPVAPGDKWGKLKNASGGRCLDVQGKSFTNGALLQVWDCVGDWNQRFNIF
ncbi:RICIN domain-containing protein [Actinoplanes oblitus]|uniref:RICIN domain-containing protein n=1 Tax=Actinoplanes oblitus TaxID=3040509 RepID=A0ABY8W671_9ACTN|nr:RICIN domain-containing protein [Actinoplanes oblitus]WIM92656.1 RICIN domain-containing protein [Actinoplanes oblitus]